MEVEEITKNSGFNVVSDVNNPSFCRGMVVACLNINSLVAHIDELRMTLNCSKIDILCINETKLDDSIADHEVCIPGFDIVRRDRSVNGRYGGGVCIYIRSNLNYKQRKDLQSHTLENLTVEITKPRSKSILVSTWYRPPDSPASYFTEFETLVGSLDAENLEYFILGDFNVDFKQGSESSNKTTLNEIFDIYGLHQLIDEPTRITEVSSTVIDLCLSNSLTSVFDSGVLHLSISDHSLIYVVRKAHYIRAETKIIEVRNMKNFNSENFINDLNHQPWTNVCRNAGDPDTMWQIWKSSLMEVIDKHAPKRTKRVGKKKSPWVTDELRRLFFKRDYLKKQAISSGDPGMWHQYRQARNLANNEMKKAKRLYFTNHLDLHKHDMKKTWKLLNELNARNSRHTTSIKEIKVSDETINSPDKIAEAFNAYFSNVGSNLAAEIPNTSASKPEDYLNPTIKTFSLQNPSIDQVKKLLKTIDVKKAAGLDKIPNKLLKIASDVVAPSLTEIFIQSIATGIFPSDWKEARVSPLYKSGAKTDPGNYRPISIIPTVSKIFEKIIYDQLYTYLNENNLLTPYQSGFRSLHSTLTALLEATNDWSVNIDNGLLNAVVFIDLKKAFDTIDHEIILLKLKNYGVDPDSLNWFRSYLTNRKQKCKVNGQLSSSTSVTCGVPQGSSLGPLLFLIYINDLPNCLNMSRPRMFADDTSISYSSNSLDEMQFVINSELENLNTWLTANKLSLNVVKTEFMIIGSRQRMHATQNVISISINNREINRVNVTKSLGMYIDSHLSWSEHIDKIAKKVSSAIGALKRVRPFISRKTAVQLYFALIQPHFDYCCSVWDGLGDTLATKLQKLQNRAVRVITRSSYDANTCALLSCLQLDNLYIRRKKLKAQLMFKILKGDMPLYLQSLFSIRNTEYNLRNNQFKLSLPKPRTNYLKRSLCYSGALLWNSFPEEMRSLTLFSQFKRATNDYYNSL